MIRYLLFCTCLCFVLTGCGQNSPSARKPGNSVGNGKTTGPAPILTITPDNFQSVVLESSKPVLVDCWAPWCGPCKILAPTIEELARQYEGEVTVAKMNIDENTAQAQQFEITAIPTVLVFKDGKVVANRVGVQPKANYEADLKNLLGS